MITSSLPVALQLTPGKYNVHSSFECCFVVLHTQYTPPTNNLGESEQVYDPSQTLIKELHQGPGVSS